MPADTVQMAPTFKEAIELVPGAYHMEVSLYRIPAPFDSGNSRMRASRTGRGSPEA